MTTSATLKFTHLSPQKMRLIADQVRGMSVDRAVTLLSFSNKKGAKIVKKVLESAIANAENNDGIDIDELKVASVEVNQGPVMKRLRPRARGRADRLLKRTSHLTVKVSEKGEQKSLWGRRYIQRVYVLVLLKTGHQHGMRILRTMLIILMLT